MTELPKPKRKVTGQISISSPATTSKSSPSTPSNLPRVRAKVDVSALPSPNPRPGLSHSSSSTGPGTVRPTLRNTPSSASLRSTTSAGSRTRSPAPPLPSPSIPTRATPTASTTQRPAFRASTSQTSTPVVRRPPSSGRNSPVKETPTARVRASAVTQNAFSRSPQVNGARISNTNTNTPTDEGGFKRPNEVENPKIRARVTPTYQAATSTSPEKYPPLLSPDMALDQPQHWQRPQTSHSPLLPDLAIADRPKLTHSPSTTLSPTFAQHAIMSQLPQHPAASAPGSPQHTPIPLGMQRSSSIKSKARRMLPYNPTVNPPNLPSTPLSPEMRTVELPLMTPTRSRSREDDSRRPSLPGIAERADNGPLLRFDPPEQSIDIGTSSESGLDDKSVEGDPNDISEIDAILETEDDVAEARVNRKIADLEITNASLLAINRSLEATKSKQRSEILKLRRMLRESLSGPLPGLPGSMPLPAYLLSPNMDDQAEAESDEEDMRDPELDARWDKVADMVENMNKKALMAVEKGREEVKAGAGRVLDWTEIEGLNSSVGSMAGTPEPERVGGIS